MSISPADLPVMNTSSPEDWLHDVRRCNSGTMDAWEAVLDRLELILDEPWDESVSTLQRNLPRWTAAVQAAEEASSRLKSGLKLTEARYRDARLAGLEISDNTTIVQRARSAGERSAVLSAEIRERMMRISSDMQSRRPRRPRGRVFVPNAPSHVDIHV